MLKVIEQIRSKGFIINLDVVTGSCLVGIFTQEDQTEPIAEGYASELPRAICLAALELVLHKVSKP